MKNKIVIASILKPVNDARMYEKFAISISKLNDVNLAVYGFKAKNKQENLPANITLFPIFDFPRLSFSRFLAPWKFYKLLIKEKPEILIVTTHELLIVSCIHKILFGGKIIYDVQENYYRNITFTTTYPPVFRNILAVYVRVKEWLARPFISHYFLAERNYEKEFGFTKGKSTILENKAWMPALNNTNSVNKKNSLKLLYTGTISEEYGIFEAIELANNLHKLDNSITLSIIGYCSNFQTLNKLKNIIKEHTFIVLLGGDSLVPHKVILQAIQTHDVGLLPYRSNKSTMNCIPTKLYEYLAYHLPMVVNQNPIWDKMIQKYDAGITINYSQFDPQTTLEILKTRTFFQSKIDSEIYWETEEKKLLEVFTGFLKNKAKV